MDLIRGIYRRRHSYLITDTIETKPGVTQSRITTGDRNYTATAFYALIENIALVKFFQKWKPTSISY